MSMVSHWQKMIMNKSLIDITSLVSRIARHVGVLENAQVTYLPSTEEYQTIIGLDHFIHAHMMREGPGNSVFMCYPRYDREFELPCPKLSLSLLREMPDPTDGKERTRTSQHGWTHDTRQDLA